MAFRVVCEHPDHLDTEKTPAAVTAMVLRLAGQLAEHLVDTEQLRDTHVELERLVHTLPAGPYQRDRGPSQWLLRMLATQTERTELVPLIDALHRRMREQQGHGLRYADGLGGPVGVGVPAGRRSSCGSRYRVVLLDEYQDTGHAQRVALSSLFGGGVDDELALTAVGDPIQSIYGWRGASATNLPRFTTDFPLADGSPGADPGAAHQLAQPAGRAAPGQRGVRRGAAALGGGAGAAARPDAGPGTIRCALLSDVVAERDWVADQLAQHLSRGARRRRGRTDRCGAGAPQRRRRADGRRADRARGRRSRSSAWPGCSACQRSPTWWRCCGWWPIPPRAPPRCGCSPGRAGGWADATSRRCGDARSQLDDSAQSVDGTATDRIVAQAAPDADAACLADAICDPGPAAAYSPTGYARIVALGRELTALRGHLTHPLPELVAEVRRVLGVDTEVRAARRVAAGWSGTEHLDAFADVVADFASRPAATVAGLLAYLDAAEQVENGLAPAEISVAHDRVQILTVHAAKGLEWQVVAVPHLSGRVFPSTASTRTWLTDAGDLPPLLRGDRATLSEHGVPVLDTVRRQRSKEVVGQDLRPQGQPRAAPRRRGTTAAVRGDHPRRGHAAVVRSPLGSVRIQAARPVGVPR